MDEIRRKYLILSSSGAYELVAGSSREAISLFEKDHPEGWQELIQVDRQQNRMTFQDYERILAAENGWEKDMRNRMLTDLVNLSNQDKPVGERVKTAP